MDLPLDLLAPALVHRSWCAEHAGHPSNERLEFLGDSVLGVIVTDHLYRAHPELDEGALTDLRKTVVNSVTLAEVAEGLRVGEHLLLGKGEELSGGREKPSILADAMEAIIGATYLATGFDGATHLVLGILASRLATARTDGADHKSRLQELAAHRFGAAPRYEVEATGPDHARTFYVTVTIDGEAHGTGVGRSKKQAEQAAARAAVDSLATDDDDDLREIHHG
ncbi:MAG TPA: ribonuclease III [Acidimicrobiales bacterium]|nr:ribonuclease III [Acidimicrobiales bacterium]